MIDTQSDRVLKKKSFKSATILSKSSKKAIIPGWIFHFCYGLHDLDRIWLCWSTHLVQVKVVYQNDKLLHWEVYV